MTNKSDLREWVYDAVVASGGRAKIVDISKHIWATHENELRSAGDLFYTWQYDMRWAAQDLRRIGKFADIAASEKRYWELK